MARFIVRESTSGGLTLTIDARAGDELTVQEALIWQLREIDYSLDAIRMHLSNIENGIDALPHR